MIGDTVRRHRGLRGSVAILWIVCAASTTRAQDAKLDSSLREYHPVPGVSGLIRGHSSAEMIDLMTPWSEGFERIYPQVSIKLDDASFEDIGDDPATTGPWLGELRGPALEHFKKRFGFAPTQIPVCWYVLAVYVQKDNPMRGGLRIMDVKKAFSTKYWNATWGDLGLDGAWFKRPVALYVPRRAFLADLIEPHCGGRSLFFKNPEKRNHSDAEVVRLVGKDAHGLALGSIGCRTDDVRALAVMPEENSKPAAATAENAYNGSYPFSGKFYLTLVHDPESGSELDAPRREFIRYVLSKQGQQVVVDAGYTPMTAEFANRALAELGLVPSGEDSPWDRVITALRVRQVPQETLGRIERITKRIGDNASYRDLESVTRALAATQLTSAVSMESEDEGATIRYRKVGARHSTAKPAGNRKVWLSVGIYHVWTERDGKATSSQTDCFQVVRERERIKIRRTR